MNKSRLLFAAAVIILPIVASVAIVSAAWTPPSANFPNGSPAAPIDTSNVTQPKTGTLNLGRLDLGALNSSFTGINLGINQLINSNGNTLNLSDVGWNTTLENSGAFYVNAVNGLVIPRPSSAPTGSIAGTIYYNSSTKTIQLYNGTAWQAIGTGGGGTGTSQWIDTTGGVYYGTVSTIYDNPIHTGGYKIKSDTDTVNQFCIGDKSTATIHYAAGTINTSQVQGGKYSYYFGGAWSEPVGSVNIATNVTCFTGSTNGKVGIGITIPNYTLDVNGIVNATDFYLNGKRFTGGTSGSQWVDGTGGIISYTGGNVGIGTTDPGLFKLNVNGNLFVGAGMNGYIVLGADSKAISWVNNDLTIANSDGNLSLSAGNNINLGPDGNINLLSPVCIDGVCKTAWPTGGSSQWTDVTGGINYAGGNVGIGTTSPNSLLHAYKDSGNNAELDIQSVAGSGNQWGIYADRATNQLRFWQGDNRLVLTSGGNVGIGTTSPKAKLDVNGAMLLEPLGSTPVGTPGMMYYDSGDKTFYCYTNGWVACAGTSGGGITFPISLPSDGLGFDIKEIAGNGGWTAFKLFNTNGTNSTKRVILAVDNSRTDNVFDIENKNKQSQLELRANGGAYFGGNVGIGTTNPKTKLTVAGGTTVDSGVGIRSGEVWTTIRNYPTSNNAAIDVTKGGAVDGSTIGTAGYNLLLNPSGGNVGIGTIDPGARLEVKASDNGQTGPVTAVKIWGPNAPADLNSAQDITWGFSSAGSAKIRAYRGGDWDTYLQFLTNPGVGTENPSGGDSPKVRMTIASNGNVGIGTTAPSSILTLIGTSTTPLLNIMTSSSVSSLYVSNTGNVGVGTITPPDKLSVYDGNVNVTGGNVSFQTISVGPPSSVNTVSCSGSGGSLTAAAGNYYWTGTYSTKYGETQSSGVSDAYCGITSGSNGSATVSLNSATNPAAVSINVYRGNSVNGPFYYVGTVSSNLSSFRDTGSIDTTRQPPIIDTTTAGINVNGDKKIQFSSDNRIFIKVGANPLAALKVQYTNPGSSGVGPGYYAYAVYAP